jgi:NADPH-dependent ferric siderophore reductase
MHQGPATNWAQAAKIGDVITVIGPSSKKFDNFEHSHYILLGDLTSVNAIKGYLTHLPATAKIDAFVHVPTEEDIISLDTSHKVNWLVTHTSERSMVNALNYLEISAQPPIVFMGLEAGLVRKIKAQLEDQFSIPRNNVVASGYWKKGLNAELYKK